jgi:hypothetical protein
MSSTRCDFVSNLQLLPQIVPHDTFAITWSEIFFLLIIQADLDTEEVYAQIQPVNTVSIYGFLKFSLYVPMP